MGEFTATAFLALAFLLPLTWYVSWSSRPQRAILVVAFFATLFGPEGSFFKFPAIPPLDKMNLPYIFLFAVALVKWRVTLRKGGLWKGIDLLLLIGIVASFITWQNNTEELEYGSWITTTVPGLKINDGIQYGFVDVLRSGFPFILGRSFFRTRKDLYEVLHFLVGAGLVQTLFLLVELRISPVWHQWIYGYGAHDDFLQTLRWGGYRPMNFTAHGLALALFMTVVLFSAILLARQGQKIRNWSGKRVAWFLAFILLVCKSTGAIGYALLFGTMLARAKPQTLVRAVTIIAAIVALYPAARATPYFPAEQLVHTAESLVGPDRAESLAFRFRNEEQLLAKAREHIWFGWGGQGRSAIYDPEMGKETSVADGHWIIVLGMRGIVGMFVAFGLLVVPLWSLRKNFRYFPHRRDQYLVAGFALTVAVTVLDLIPNGLFATYPYLLAGMLMGIQKEAKSKSLEWSTPEPQAAPRKKTASRSIRRGTPPLR